MESLEQYQLTVLSLASNASQGITCAVKDCKSTPSLSEILCDTHLKEMEEDMNEWEKEK